MEPSATAMRAGQRQTGNSAAIGEIDARAFRRALSQFATGVAVVTAQDLAGPPLGLTISSFNAVSIDPPLVLFSIERGALSLAALMKAEGFAINVLAEQQRHLSDRFARPRSDKWAAVEHVPGCCGAPLLSGALAHFECVPYANYDGGDHIIFVVRVMRYSCATVERPLVFFRGSYRNLTEEEHAPMWPLPIHY